MKLIVALTFANLLTAGPGSAPVLQWVQQMSGSGQSLATASAVDSQGNLYITGNTTALDFPTIAAYQPQSSSSPLTRVDAASGVAQKLYAPLLSGATTFAVDPENPSTLYATYSYGPGDTDSASNWTNSLIRSTDGGVTWSTAGSFPSSLPIVYLLVDPTHSNVLYACSYYLGILKSTDGGATWTASNQGIAPYEGLSTIRQIWVDPNSPSVLFATSPNQLYRSQDGGANWSAVMPVSGSLFNVAFDPFTPGTIYISTSQKIDKSTDDGQTWIPIYNAPAQFGNVWADPVNKGELYFTGIGANQGLFVSTDAGATWTLKTTTPLNTLTFDPAHGAIYAIRLSPSPIFVSSDGFNTYQPWPPGQNGNSVLVAGSSLFVTSAITTDVFVTKLDPNGNIVYSTYFGGSEQDTAAALAVGTDGSVYVTGSTQSSDFPTSTGAFLSTLPTGGYGSGSFVFKLNPDGSLGWSTYFADSLTTPYAIAVDASGSPYVTGATTGDLPVTSAAFQTQAPAVPPCPPGTIGGCPFPPVAGFLSRLKADGSALTFSTYVYQAATRFTNQFNAIALDANGNAYLAGVPTVSLMSADGTTLIASNTVKCQCTISAISLDANSDVYTAGVGTQIPTTPGAFQTTMLPPVPTLPGADFFPQEAVVFKFDSMLSQVTAATYLGGEFRDNAVSLAVDSTGTVIVAGNTQSKGFPTAAPFQFSFSQNSGFVAGLDPDLSTLLYSTYLGDWRFFGIAGASPDNQGNILLAGSTLASNPGPLCVPPPCNISGGAIFANKVALTASPTVRLDSIENAASLLGTSITPGEMVAVAGAGFGPDAQLLMNGVSVALTSQTANRLTAQLPSDFGSADVAVMIVASGASTSNSIVVPVSAASPGVFSADGSGYGQGYILNSDGTMNSPSNPAAGGSAITVFATGVGSITEEGAYAVTAQPVSVFINGLYADGIAASVQNGMYAISVYIPSFFKLPPQVPVLMVSGAVFAINPAYSVMRSQPGIALSVAAQ